MKAEKSHVLKSDNAKQVLIITPGSFVKQTNSYDEVFTMISDAFLNMELIGHNAFQDLYVRGCTESTSKVYNSALKLVQTPVRLIGGAAQKVVEYISSFGRNGVQGVLKSIFSDLALTTQKHVERLYKKIEKAKKLYPDYTIALTGYSMGGSLSMNASLLYYERHGVEIPVYVDSAFGVRNNWTNFSLFNLNSIIPMDATSVTGRFNFVHKARRKKNIDRILQEEEKNNMPTRFTWIHNNLWEGDSVNSVSRI
eukprot:g3185.t1